MAIITSKVLPADVLQVISEVVIQEAENRRVGRQIVLSEPVDKGAQTYKYRKFTGFSKVDVIPEGSEFPLEGIDITEASVNLEKIGKAFAVTREENLANKIVSIAQLARDAARVVALKEDELILNSLVNNAGSIIAAAATWSSTGDPYDDVSTAMANLEEYAYNPNALVLNPAQAADLRGIDADSHATYVSMIEGLGIKIYVAPKLTAGTGLLLDAKQAGVLALAEDITVEGPAYDQKNQSYLVNVFERIAPAVWRPNADVKITGI